MAGEHEAPDTLPNVERFVGALVMTARAMVLYPQTSEIPLQTARSAEDALEDLLERESELRLSVNKNGLLFHGRALLERSAACEALAFELYRRGLAEVRFRQGASAHDVVAVLSVLKSEPEVVRVSGGFEARLWEQGVTSVTVAEAHFEVIGEDGDEHLDDLEQPPRGKLDELLAAAYAGRSRENVTITRLFNKPSTIARYLTETYADSQSGGSAAAAERLSEMVAVAYESADADAKARLVDSLAEAIAVIDPQMRRTLLVDHAFPEARTSEAMASFVHGLDIDEVCRMLAEGVTESQISRDGLARAIRVLALVSTADRDDILASAAGALRHEGVSDAFIGDVVEQAVPTRLRATAESGSRPSAGQEDAIMRFVDLAPAMRTPHSPHEDPDAADLSEEARRGITDGDVILALVDLVCIDSRESGSVPSVTTLEDTLDVLMERGEVDIAADAAEALREAANDTSLPLEQRERIELVLSRFSRPEDVGAIAQALRVHAQDSVQYKAALRLIDALGAIAIVPLLEQLAKEPDMAVRKTLIEILSRRAEGHVAEVAVRLGDSRWYFVRNVVSILGSTRSPDIVPYLERTLRHVEPRVRRETIRALSGVRERTAAPLLVTALADEDEQNVLLAARYLGLASVYAAVPALTSVARGEGRGNRGVEPRVEAIAALGRIGDASALAALKTLAGKRLIGRGAGAREIRIAAEAAIADIKARGGST